MFQFRAQVKAALASGKQLTTDVANDTQLRKDFAYDETAENDRLDDEYEILSGIKDPRVLITTSRSPSSKLTTFSKEFRLLLPTATRINRGGMTLPELVRAANAAGLSDVVHIHEHRGAPSALMISHLPHGPTIFFSLHNVQFRNDIPLALRGNIPESYPNLIFDGFTTPLGLRVKRILQHLFPPRDAHMKAGNRTITFKRLPDDSIEVRHHIHTRTGFDQLELSEVGPRMTMRAFRIMNSTLETQDGDIEWQMTHYTITSRKKTVL